MRDNVLSSEDKVAFEVPNTYVENVVCPLLRLRGNGMEIITSQKAREQIEDKELVEFIKPIHRC